MPLLELDPDVTLLDGTRAADATPDDAAVRRSRAATSGLTNDGH